LLSDFAAFQLPALSFSILVFDSVHAGYMDIYIAMTVISFTFTPEIIGSREAKK
jgi:hypothetical protein